MGKEHPSRKTTRGVRITCIRVHNEGFLVPLLAAQNLCRAGLGESNRLDRKIADAPSECRWTFPSRAIADGQAGAPPQPHWNP